MAFAKTRKIGGSIVVTIPKETVKELKLQSGEDIEIEVRKPKKSYFGIAKGISSFTKKDRAWCNDEDFG